MAGDEEVEAVARAMWDARESRDPSGERIGDRADDKTRETVFWDRAVAEDLWPASRRDQLSEARLFLELLDRPLDRVRSRPAGGTKGISDEDAKALDALADHPKPGKIGSTEGEDHEAGIEDVIERAVHALLPIVPVHGSWQRGYRISDQMGRGPFYATPEEWVDAANAVCELHAALSHGTCRVSGTEPDTDEAGRRRYPTMLHGDAATTVRLAEHGCSEPDMAKERISELEAIVRVGRCNVCGDRLSSEPDTARRRVAQETLDWMDANRPGTEPDTAKLVKAAQAVADVHQELIRATTPGNSEFLHAQGPNMIPDERDRYEALFSRWHSTTRSLGAALAGFSVDAGKPEER